MAVKISGVLKDGTGKPVQNCTIQLKAKRNSTTVVVNTLASENPDEAGRYSMDVEYGQYSVILLVEGFPPSHAGTITVYEDSQPGTLNDFLGAMTEDDARPEALRRFELMVEEVARNASAVAQNTAAAKKSARQAEEYKNDASEYARNKFTFYKTSSDPDGTIAGLAATTDGQSFWVAQGPDALSAAWQYQNKAGVAVLQAKQPGTAAVTGTIRVFPTTTAAQADADAGNILNGGKCFALNASENIIADEYTNTSGTLTPTGRKIASRKSVVIGCVDSWVNNNLYPFDSLSSPNENSVSMNVAAVSTIAYREAYSALLSPVAVGDIITVRYKYSGTGGAPTIGLKTSLNGTFVSNQPTLTSSNDWQELQLTATAATATLLAISVNTRLATTVQLSIIAYASKKNAITTAILNSLDSISSLNGKVRIGSVDSWVNNNGYPFSVFSQVNNNRVNYVNSTGVYSEMYANINVASGATVELNYALNITSGRLFARLANGSTWTGDEVQLAGGGVRQTVKLVASADTKQLKIYSKAEVSSGSIFAEVNYGQKNALTEQIDSLYSAIASANAILAILSQDSTFDSFVKSSPYTYTLSDAGTAYKQLLNTINAISDASTVKMMYKITSEDAALKIQSRNGNAWGANEKALIADGKYHEVDLAIASGQVFSGWGVYSPAKSGGYTADVTMIPISADGVFFTPATAILYGLMASSISLDSRVTALESGQVTNQNTDVIFPSYFYAVDGRPQRFYGANMVSGDRPWRNGADIVLSSHGYEGKSVLLKDAVPDAMIMPSEINGPTLNINARADGSGNVFRKKAAFTKLAATQTGSVKVATIMDSLGERCVPWLYFAINATGATYVGAGSRTTRGMTDDGGYVLPNTPAAGIPFDGRGGWTTFDYIGKTQKTNFSQPFLRDAVAADFAAYPQYCYDKAYSGQSYADNPNLAGYHIFDVTAWMAASGVSTSDKLVVVIQLGYNDLYYSYTPQQTVDAQEFMIAKFREKIANSRFVISHQAFGWSGVSAPQNWPDFAKWITEKIRKFDNRLSEKIIVAPAWAQLSYKYGMNETITATSDTGVQTVSLPDDVHPGELGGAQWGDALVAPVLAAWNW
ncbi:prophage tail fiber N-terminal domain-containing protein [Escherichia coli]|uniref:prophage tail fiber N-terminal domain-containing protein n=1 Tax=Escherichia coli TaxID=562 RepID=UPI001E60E01D|nr:MULTISPECIES: prophage tail fiber N-terminal domain-containing protein [Escherichia]UGS30707.1 prophage tail fiber N-terminal domain-containing protein [Escherichia coli]